MIDETSVDVLAFACVAFEFPDSAGGDQPLFGAFAARRCKKFCVKSFLPDEIHLY